MALLGYYLESTSTIKLTIFLILFGEGDRILGSSFETLPRAISTHLTGDNANIHFVLHPTFDKTHPVLDREPTELISDTQTMCAYVQASIICRLDYGGQSYETSYIGLKGEETEEGTTQHHSMDVSTPREGS